MEFRRHDISNHTSVHGKPLLFVQIKLLILTDEPDCYYAKSSHPAFPARHTETRQAGLGKSYMDHAPSPEGGYINLDCRTESRQVFTPFQ